MMISKSWNGSRPWFRDIDKVHQHARELDVAENETARRGGAGCAPSMMTRLSATTRNGSARQIAQPAVGFERGEGIGRRSLGRAGGDAQMERALAGIGRKPTRPGVGEQLELQQEPFLIRGLPGW